MICPGLIVDRVANFSEVQQNVVNTDPVFYSYFGCTCAAPLVPYYHVDSTGTLHILGVCMFMSVIVASLSVYVCSLTPLRGCISATADCFQSAIWEALNQQGACACPCGRPGNVSRVAAQAASLLRLLSQVC